jgi:hypothetical protein
MDDPGQVSVQLSISTLMLLHWAQDGSSLEFRAEFFKQICPPLLKLILVLQLLGAPLQVRLARVAQQKTDQELCDYLGLGAG